jgi:ribosomal protein S21
MRISVVDGDLQTALKRWQKVSIENRAALQRHRWHIGPSELRKLKERKARQRHRRKLYGRG